jgi:hypothetical protein
MCVTSTHHFAIDLANHPARAADGLSISKAVELSHLLHGRPAEQMMPQGIDGSL